MIWIGNQTTCWTATLTEPFDYAVANGFDAFEWFPDKKPNIGWDESDLDADRRAALRELALARGMRFSVHARWQADVLAPDSEPVLLKDIELARDLGAALLNIHLSHQAGLAAWVAAASPLLERAAALGLQIAVENTPEHSPELFNELFGRLLAQHAVPASHVGMCLDLGHANLCQATHNDYLGFVDRLDAQVPIIHLHLHENWGDADTHLPLFTGPAAQHDAGIRALLQRMRQRRFSGSIILEQWPQPPSLLNQARDRLLGMLAGIEGPPMAAASGSPGVPAATPALNIQSHTLSMAGPVPDSPAPTFDADDTRDPAQTPAGDDTAFLTRLVAADKRGRSWREKLEGVSALLAAPECELTAREFALVAVYLRLLGTGAIPCTEDGRHFRPAHHARIALAIQERLAGCYTPETALLLRRIYPWLPSTAQAFQRAEPLTRIRDIAHRNDIPQDLKREIKTSLQNKLHRCAGPEDLTTSESLLERITAPGADYSAGFVEEFKRFHEELKEFFNARSLREQLEALAPAADTDLAGLIRGFLERMGRPGLPEQLATLGQLTRLRHSLLAPIGSRPAAQTQPFLLADIALEDFAFVLLSQAINATDAVAGEAAWQPLLDLLMAAVENLELSSVAPEESGAIAAELRAWRSDFAPSNRESLLRLKATLERGRRLAGDYTDRILGLFPQEAERLGRALGVAERAVRIFAEGEIRGSVVFQVSKLVSILLRRIRQALALPAWDILVPGQAEGRLQPAQELDQLGRSFAEPVIALLERAAGDEEIPRGITGVILAHEIPHLSHLAVRARQAGVVFLADGASADFEQLRNLRGLQVCLSATFDKVEWEKSDGRRLSLSPDPRHRPRIAPPPPAPRQPCLRLEEATSKTAGRKADGLRRLAELARHEGAGFQTAPALVVPFGVMETTIQTAPDVEAQYRRLVSGIDKLPPDAFDAACESLAGLIGRLVVPGGIASAVGTRFNAGSRLMVRSSANCEDLDEWAGAGLYESVGGVAPAGIAEAVRTVWSSLWTRRAALSRREAGIPHEQARMAVIIQQMLEPEYSFILHTVNPITLDASEVYAELAVGLGETLASAAVRGTPYRFVCWKEPGGSAPTPSPPVPPATDSSHPDHHQYKVLAFANFSQALWCAAGGGLRRATVDYSRIELSRSAPAREALARPLAAVACRIEAAFGGPQDIEGVVVENQLYLVQTRAQQGLSPEARPRDSKPASTHQA